MNNNEVESKVKILFSGESLITYTVHVKGFSAFDTGSYREGLAPIRDALINYGCDFTYIRNHEVPKDFPTTAKELNKFDVIIFSDIPSDSLLLHDDTFVRGKRTPNRLRLIVDFVKHGGGFLMVGGYMSFSGFQAKANYQFTPLTEILPVELYGIDDRIETPEGVVPDVVIKDHPILKGIPDKWPHFLGYNKLKPGKGKILMSCQGNPFLAIREFGKGRVAAFASDCSPHWASNEFTTWQYYPKFVNQLVNWLAKRIN